jgi:natural product precursor
MKKSKIKKLSFNKNSLIELNSQHMHTVKGGSVNIDLSTIHIGASNSRTLTQTNPKSGYSYYC